VSLVWTPPTARRVLPGDDASDDDDAFVPPGEEEKDEKKDTEEGVAEAVKEAWSSAATATATRTDDQSPTPSSPSIDLALEDPELMFCGATAGEFILVYVRAIRLMMSCLVFRFFPERRDTPGRLRGFNRIGVRVLSGMFQNVGMQRVGALRERRRTVHRRGRQRAVLADERTGIRSIRPG
jgi:hypothetical protein